MPSGPTPMDPATTTLGSGDRGSLLCCSKHGGFNAGVGVHVYKPGVHAHMGICTPMHMHLMHNKLVCRCCGHTGCGCLCTCECACNALPARVHIRASVQVLMRGQISVQAYPVANRLKRGLGRPGSHKEGVGWALGSQDLSAPGPWIQELGAPSCINIILGSRRH